MKKHLPIFFFIITTLFLSPLRGQDFEFTEIPNPNGYEFLNFLAATDDGVAYLSYSGPSFNTFLYQYDGEVFEEIPIPDGYTFSFYLTQQGDDVYFALSDPDFASVLGKFDGTNFEIITDPDADPYNTFLNDFAFTLDGVPYFSFIDFITFENFVQFPVGNELQLFEFPDDLTYGNFVGEFGGVSYFFLNDTDFNTLMYAYDDGTFEQIDFPMGFSNPFVQDANENRTLLSAFNPVTGFQDVYAFNEAGFNALVPPVGLSIGSYIGTVDDIDYFTFNDDSFVTTIWEFDGTAFDQVMYDPAFEFTFGTAEDEEGIFMRFTDDFFSTFTLGIVSDLMVEFVDNPSGLSYNSYVTRWADEGGVFLNYVDPNYYEDQLHYYDFETLVGVPLPDDLTFDFFAFELDGLLYFVFRDSDFSRFVYRLGSPNVEPTATDGSVSTLIETPYLFSAEDFNFSDMDIDDTLAAIQIIEKPTAGILHLNGENIGTGDIIPTENIPTLTYVPFNDGFGEPYDSLEFRVFDGSDFSLETYKMYINVTAEPLSTSNNPLAVNLSVFPNPASDYININAEGYQPKDLVSITIFNQLGVAIDQITTYGIDQTIPVDHLPGGVYLMVVKEGEFIATRKIVVR